MRPATSLYTAEKLEQHIDLAKDNSEEHVKDCIASLAVAKIFVLLDHPWDGISVPSQGTKLMHVSDDKNMEQPMLAVFTRTAKAEIFSAAPANSFKYPVLVDAAWAFLGLAESAGIWVNPNAPDGSFRVSPAVARVLRNLAEKHLSKRINPPTADKS